MRDAHVLLHCRLKISSLQIYFIIMAIIYFVGFITVYIGLYDKTYFVSHTRLEIVCEAYNVNIANKWEFVRINLSNLIQRSMGEGAQLAPMLSPELAFSPPKPKKKISDDVTKFLRIDDWCHGCALVFFLIMTFFKTDLIAPNSTIPIIEFCLLALNYSHSTWSVSHSEMRWWEQRSATVSTAK